MTTKFKMEMSRMTRSLVPMIFGQFVQLKKGKNSHGIMRQPNGNFVPPLTAIVAAQIVEGKFVDSRTVGTLSESSMEIIMPNT